MSNPNICLLLAGTTVKLVLSGTGHFDIPNIRIPPQADEGRCPGLMPHGGKAEWLTVSDSSCKMFDTALAWLCLRDPVLLVPDQSGIFYSWAFCKKFIAECPKIGPSATIDRMASVIVKVSVRGRKVQMTILDLFKELEPSWRQPVSTGHHHLGKDSGPASMRHRQVPYSAQVCSRLVSDAVTVLQLPVTLSCILPNLPFTTRSC